MKVQGVESNFGQGASQVTSKNTDLAIQGNGMFVVRNGDEEFYTRAGSFTFDEQGNLVTPLGEKVQGVLANAAGEITAGPNAYGDLTLPIGQVIDPITTTTMEIGGNLSAEAQTGDEVTTSISYVDSLDAASS